MLIPRKFVHNLEPDSKKISGRSAFMAKGLLVQVNGVIERYTLHFGSILIFVASQWMLWNLCSSIFEFVASYLHPSKTSRANGVEKYLARRAGFVTYNPDLDKSSTVQDDGDSFSEVF